MDRLAVPVAFLMVLALVAVLIGAPLVPHFAVPGLATLGATLDSLPDALNGLMTPRPDRDTDLAGLLAGHKDKERKAPLPGLVGRWAGVIEAYVPAPTYLGDYPALPGPEKASVTVEVDRPASTAQPGGSGGGNGSSGGAVNYESD